jgi:hypothetical protein
MKKYFRFLCLTDWNVLLKLTIKDVGKYIPTYIQLVRQENRNFIQKENAVKKIQNLEI